MARVFETFSPADYLEQIRKTAYYLWEETGSQCGSAFDLWLEAENRFLDALAKGQASPPPEDPKPPAQ